MSQPRILVVDDDELITDVFREGFSPEFEVLSAANAVEGLASLQHNDIHVVVSDIRMPEMDGLAFLGRAREVAPDVPVIFLTAYKNADHLTRALQLGAFDMADKPFSLDPMRALLRRALQQHRRLVQRRRSETLARELNRCEDLDGLLTYLRNNLGKALGLRLFSLFLYCEEDDTLALVATNHVPPSADSILQVAQLKGPMRRAIDTHEAATLQPEERAAGAQRERYEHDVSLTVPLLVGEKLVGVLNLNDKTEAPADFDELDLAFLTIAAEHVGSAIAVRQQAAELARALSTLRDTQRRLIQSEKLASLTKLIAGVAHELKNPLTSLHLAAVNLEHTLRHTPPQRAPEALAPFVRSIHSDVDRLQHKVESFLAFARPRQSAPALTPVHAVVGSVLEEVQPRAEAAQVELTLSTTDDAVHVEVDPKGLREAVLNLVVNGIEASSAGGWVRVEVGAHQGEAIIRVADSGAGVGPAVIDHIFDIFFTTKPRGSGIGLSQVHAFCDAHGGRVELLPQEQHTTFQITLRRSEVAS